MVVAHCRKRNMFLPISYWLIGKRIVFRQVINSVQYVICLLCTVELSVNVKVSFNPTQKVDFFGAVVNSMTVYAYLLQIKFVTILERINQMGKNPCTTASICLQLLGHTASCILTPFSRLHPYCLQGWLLIGFCLAFHKIDTGVCIPSEVLKDPDQVCKGILFSPALPTKSTVTSALLFG